MKSKLTKIALAAAIGLALAFAFSRFGKDGGDNGKTYKTVKIGDQVWMAENLNYDAEGSKCYGNDPANCKKYGRLYDWKTAATVCPSGWHLPSNAEWDVLMKFVDPSCSSSVCANAGTKLKATSGWNDYDGSSGNGTDDYGFSALPGGNGNGSSVGYFFHAGSNGYWWSASEHDSNYAYYLRIYYYRKVNLFSSYLSSHYDNSALLSVRCLQDPPKHPSSSSAMLSSSSVAVLSSLYAIADTSGTFSDGRDGKNYRWVKIGAQIWMAKNLNYNASGSKCYKNKSANCDKYGRFYDWNMANAVCPDGWHLPSNEEWDALYRYADGTSGTESPYKSKTAGKYLKAKSGWNWDDMNGKSGNGTDNYGFAALPGGHGYSAGNFDWAGYYGNWWSASERNAYQAYYRYMYFRTEYAFWHHFNKKIDFFSVRCLLDPPPPKHPSSGMLSSSSVAGTRGMLSDGRDGKNYRLVKIGAQTWMAENLNYNAKGSKCYNNSEANCMTYGRLYNWKTATTACPSGWHLPSNAEWNVLMKFTNPSYFDNSHCANAGTKLKATSGWNTDSGYIAGTDNYGFSALSGGYGYSDDGFYSGVGRYGSWWSASEYGSYDAYYRYMYHDNEFAIYDYLDKFYLRSVRCLQD